MIHKIGILYIIDYFICSMSKFEKTQVSCNCLGLPVPNQQKYFLARKRQPDEFQSTHFTRRVIKSTEVKNQSEGKGQKKSLKKRPSSYVNSDHNFPTSELNKQQNDVKPNFLQEVPIKSKNSQTKGVQTPTFVPKHSFVFKFPQTTTAVRMPTFLHTKKQHIQDKPNNFHFVNPGFSISTPIQPRKYIQPIKSNPPMRLLETNFTRPYSRRQQQINFTQTQQKRSNIIQSNPIPSISARQINFGEAPPPSTPFLSEKFIRSHTQNYSHIDQDPLMIQDFQKIFKYEQDFRNESNLGKEKIALKPREAQRSKRFQQQQLMGRFAQSEDEDISQSTPSQVIGKGFDRTYQDFIDNQQPIVGEQTKASRSTNTKVSNFRGQRHVFDQHIRTKFGNLSHFTSYDRL